MNYYIHPQALVESESIGERTRIWAFTHVLPGARIGSDCNLCDHVFIENDVIIGNRVTIKWSVRTLPLPTTFSRAASNRFSYVRLLWNGALPSVPMPLFCAGLLLVPEQ